MTIETLSTYVKAHERIVLAVVFVFALWLGIGKIQDTIAAHDKITASVSEQAAAVQAQVTKEQAAASAAEEAKYAALTTQVQQQNAQLIAANSQLAAALTKQQTVDKTLPPPALAQRIETLAALPPNSVTPTPGNSFSVTNDGAVQIAVTLEKTSTLSQELVNVSTEKSNDEKLLTESNALASNLKSQIDGLNLAITKNGAACEDDKKVLRDDVKKARRNGFKWGFALGLGIRDAIKIITGK